MSEHESEVNPFLRGNFAPWRAEEFTDGLQVIGEIPPDLKPLINSCVGGTQGLQNNLPLSQFTGWDPRQTAGLSDLQQWGMQNIPGLGQTEPGYQGAFNALATIPELSSRPVETRMSTSPSTKKRSAGISGHPNLCFTPRKPFIP